MPSFSKSPTANSGGCTSDAANYSTSESAYSASSTGAANFSVPTTNGFVGQEIYYNSLDDLYNVFCWETFLEFDTSGSGSVDTAVLKIYLAVDYSTTDFTIEVYAFDYGTAVTDVDWRTPTQLSAFSPLLGSLSTSGIGAAGLKTITLSTSAVNLSGPTRLILAANRLRTATQPTTDVSESIEISISSSLLEYTTTASDPSVASVSEVGVSTRSTVRPEPSVSSRAQVGVSTQSTVRPEPSVSSVAEVGVSTRSALGVSNDVTVNARTQVGASTRSQPTITVSIDAATEVGASTRSTVRPEPSVASVSEVGVSTRSQPTITVSVPTVARVGAALSVSGELAASIPGIATATFAAPTATVAFAAPTATATITAPTATMTFSKEP